MLHERVKKLYTFMQHIVCAWQGACRVSDVWSTVVVDRWLGGASPLRTLMMGTVSRTARMSVATDESEGSLRQNTGPTNRNCIWDSHIQARRHVTSKPDNHPVARLAGIYYIICTGCVFNEQWKLVTLVFNTRWIENHLTFIWYCDSDIVQLAWRNSRQTKLKDEIHD